MSTCTLTEEIAAASVNRIVSRTPAERLSGIASAGVEAFRNVSRADGPLLLSASATALWASTLPWPNHELQVPSASPVFAKSPRLKGARGETSHAGFGSKLAGGVRG